METQTKIIRLQSGEDIVAEFQYESNYSQVVMFNPMTLFFKRLSEGRSVVMMAPWLPAELVSENIAIIPATQILSFIEPKQVLINYYLKSVEESNSLITANARQIEQALESSFEEDPDGDDFFDEESALEELQELIKGTGSKGRPIH